LHPHPESRLITQKRKCPGITGASRVDHPRHCAIRIGSTAAVWLALAVVFAFSHSAMYAPQAAFMSEIFDARVRYSAASLGAQVASVLAGGEVRH
jgi:hypothetical protein